MMAITFSQCTSALARRVSDKNMLGLAAILGLGIFLRFYALNGHYFYVQDSTIQISGAKNILLRGYYPYEHYAPGGPAMALLPFLAVFDFSFMSAQVGVALYGVVLILLSWVIVKRVSPSSWIAPHLAALFVATNPALVAGSRVIQFDVMQTTLVATYLLVIICQNSGSRRWASIVLSYAIGGFLMIMKTPNLAVVALGTAYLVAQPVIEGIAPRERKCQWAWTGIGLAVFALFLAASLWLSSEETRKITTGLRGLFSMHNVWPNLKALLASFASPLDPPATAVVFTSNVPGRIGWEWPLMVGQALVLAIGLISALRQRALEAFALLAVGIGLASFYAGYKGWQMRYNYPLLFTALCFLGLGTEKLIKVLGQPRAFARPLAAGLLAIPLLLIAAPFAIALHADWDMLASWGSEDSLRLNGVNIFPEDVAAISQILTRHPKAYVISSIASLIDVIDRQPSRDTFDLHAYGVRNRLSEDSVDELGRRIEQVLRSGRDLIYVVGWYEIDRNPQGFDNDFGMYLDFIKSRYDHRLSMVYEGSNTYRRSLQRFIGRPYVYVYLIRSVHSGKSLARFCEQGSTQPVIELLGADLPTDAEVIGQGGTLSLNLHWLALKTPAANYKVFAHLYDLEGHLIAQHDSEPCDWKCPTSTWSEGDVMVDSHSIPLSQNLGSATCLLTVGLYDESSRQRLTAYDDNNQRLPEDEVVLAKMRLGSLSN